VYLLHDMPSGPKGVEETGFDLSYSVNNTVDDDAARKIGLEQHGRPRPLLSMTPVLGSFVSMIQGTLPGLGPLQDQSTCALRIPVSDSYSRFLIGFMNGP
jgi:hypothetical protein